MSKKNTVPRAYDDYIYGDYDYEEKMTLKGFLIATLELFALFLVIAWPLSLLFKLGQWFNP